MNKLTEAFVSMIGVALKAGVDVIYDIVIFPIAAVVHSAVKHIPVLGPTLVQAIDHWIERLSMDWPDKLP